MAWHPRGFVQMGSVTPASCRYVTNYITKADNSFQMQSTGIGKRHALRNAINYMENPAVMHHGHEACLPRYYQKILKQIWDDKTVTRILKQKGEERRKRQIIEHLALGHKYNYIYDWERAYARQEEKNIKGRELMNRKNP